MTSIRETVAATSPGVLERLLGSPLAQQAERELVAENHANRVSLVAQLESVLGNRRSLDAAAQAKLAPLQADHERQTEALRATERAMQSVNVVWAHDVVDFDATANSARRDLMLTADPSIEITQRDLRRLAERTRDGFREGSLKFFSAAGIKREPINNSVRIEQIVDNIRVATDELERLKTSAADPSPVVQRVRREFRLDVAQ